MNKCLYIASKITALITLVLRVCDMLAWTGINVLFDKNKISNLLKAEYGANSLDDDKVISRASECKKLPENIISNTYPNDILIMSRDPRNRVKIYK